MIARLLVLTRKPQELSKLYLHNIYHVIIVRSLHSSLRSEFNNIVESTQRKSIVLIPNYRLDPLKKIVGYMVIGRYFCRSGYCNLNN